MLKAYGGIFCLRRSKPEPGFDSFLSGSSHNLSNLWESPSNRQLQPVKTVALGDRELHVYRNRQIDDQFVRTLIEAACRQRDNRQSNQDDSFAFGIKDDISPDSFTGRGLVFIFETETEEKCTRRIWLITDRIASRKIYYARNDRFFIWSTSLSELCLVLDRLDIDLQLDITGLHRFLDYLHLPEACSLFEGIACIPPASILSVDENQISIHSYGKSYFCPERTDTLEFEMQLKQAIKHSMDDCPPEGAGLFLSGGLDSSLLAAVGKKKNIKMHTYSAGFYGMPDELKDAEAIARDLGTSHHAFEIKPAEIEKLLHDVVSVLGYPTGNPSALATFLVADRARNDVKGLYSGMGSDELFAGHTKHIAARYWYTLRPLLSLTRKARFVFSRIRNEMTGRPTAINHYIDLYRFFNSVEFDELLNNKRNHTGGCYAEWVKGSLHRSVFGTDVYAWLVDGLLPLATALTAYHGLTLHTPLCSDPMLNLAARIPFSLKVKGTRGKRILYNVAVDFLPQYVLKKKRQGFTLPMGQWLRGPLRYLMETYLNDQTIENRGLFDAAAIQKIVSTHLAGRADLSLQIWALISLEVWQRIFIDQRRCRQ